MLYLFFGHIYLFKKIYIFFKIKKHNSIFMHTSINSPIQIHQSHTTVCALTMTRRQFDTHTTKERTTGYK
jgi:hypothetical protein